MSETSPTPWRVCDGAFWRIYDAAEAEVVNAEGVVSEDLSERIAHAVNCHAEMVEALKAAEKLLTRQNEVLGVSIPNNLALSKIRSALARATQTNTGE